jgi:hypothetical protein
MSYAGPASRDKRALELESTAPGRLHNLDLNPRSPSPQWPSRSRQRDRTTALAAGIAIGLVVGAGIALLFAPQSGEDTREAIADRGRRVADRGKDVWDDLRDELGDARRRRGAAWRHNGHAKREREERG